MQQEDTKYSGEKALRHGQGRIMSGTLGKQVSFESITSFSSDGRSS